VLSYQGAPTPSESVLRTDARPKGDHQQTTGHCYLLHDRTRLSELDDWSTKDGRGGGTSRAKEKNLMRTLRLGKSFRRIRSKKKKTGGPVARKVSLVRGGGTHNEAGNQFGGCTAVQVPIGSGV